MYGKKKRSDVSEKHGSELRSCRSLFVTLENGGGDGGLYGINAGSSFSKLVLFSSVELAHQGSVKLLSGFWVATLSLSLSLL